MTAPTVVLTRRQTRILTLRSFGRTADEVAEELGVSIDTVKRDVQQARRQLNAKNTPHLLLIVLRLGLIDNRVAS